MVRRQVWWTRLILPEFIKIQLMSKQFTVAKLKVDWISSVVLILSSKYRSYVISVIKKLSK